MAFRAFRGVICKVTRTANAPNSIICHIWNLYLPMRLTAIRMNTARRTITGIIAIMNRSAVVYQQRGIVVQQEIRGVLSYD